MKVTIVKVYICGSHLYGLLLSYTLLLPLHLDAQFWSYCTKLYPLAKLLYLECNLLFLKYICRSIAASLTHQSSRIHISYLSQKKKEKRIHIATEHRFYPLKTRLGKAIGGEILFSSTIRRYISIPDSICASDTSYGAWLQPQCERRRDRITPSLLVLWGNPLRFSSS